MDLNLRDDYTFIIAVPPGLLYVIQPLIDTPSSVRPWLRGQPDFPTQHTGRSGNLLGQETALLPQYRLTPAAGSLECGNRAHSAVIAFTFIR